MDMGHLSEDLVNSALESYEKGDIERCYDHRFLKVLRNLDFYK